jgi:uncharacterized protein YndB with AHSA1/START domain
MDAREQSGPTSVKNDTTVERRSEREIVVTRTFNGPARIVFEAWTKPELFKQWWVPKSSGLSLLSCELDVRVGGSYRLVYGHEGSTMEFHGRYIEVTPHTRLVWTNEESDQGAVTTVTFEEQGGKTLLVVHELYPSKEAFDAEHGMEDAMGETFEQLDDLLVTLGASADGHDVGSPQAAALPPGREPERPIARPRPSAVHLGQVNGRQSQGRKEQWDQHGRAHVVALHDDVEHDDDDDETDEQDGREPSRRAGLGRVTMLIVHAGGSGTGPGPRARGWGQHH